MNYKGASRDKLQIIHDILVVCRAPEIKTRLMMLSFLDYDTTKRKLADMIVKGLVVQQDTHFVTTQKGIDTCKAIERAYELAGISIGNNERGLYY